MSASADVRRDFRAQLRGVENLLVPSFTGDLRRLDEAGIRLDVRRSIDHGFVATACALEAGLTPDEQRRFIDVACSEAGGRIRVSVTLGAAMPAAARELLAYAADRGASHAHLGTPQGFAPRSDADVVEYVEDIAGASRVPLCLVADRFVFPQLHPSGLPLGALERLADLETVAALGLASLDSGLIEECCERFSGRWLVGSPHLALQPILFQHFGAQWSGPWAAEALQSPERRHVVDFVEHLAAARYDAAMRLYWSLAPALGASARVAGTYTHTGAQHFPLVKYQQWLSGGNGGLTRQPVMRMFQRDMQAIRGGLAAVGVTCPDPDAAFFAGRSARGVAA